LRLHITRMLIVLGHARFAGIYQKLGDCILVSPGDPRNDPDGLSLTEKVKDRRAGIGVELSHTPYLRSMLARLRTNVSLNATAPHALFHTPSP